MRRRLLIVLLALSAAAITGFAWPLLSSTAAERTQRLIIDRTADLDRFAVLAQQAGVTGDTGQLADEVSAYAELYREGVLVLDQRRRVLAAAGDLRPEDPGLGPLIDGALRNETGQPMPQLRPWSSGEVVMTRPVGAGTRVEGVVAMRVAVRTAAADVARHWALILLGAVAAAVGFVLLALVVARWVLRPLAELERGVLAVAAGRQGEHVTSVAGPVELRALTESFNRMSDAVAAAAEQQRQLVADASHQLRNPMAALRLRVDALAPSVPAAARTAYRSLSAEVERLESLLDGLLALASAENVAMQLRGEDARCAVGEIVAERLDAWEPAARRAGVGLVNELSAEPPVLACADTELAQVLDVLLDNAVRYAGPGASVVLRCDHDARMARLVVDDDGPGLSPEERELATRRFWRASRAGGGTGLGLAIAERLLAARAGRLEVRASERGGLAVAAVLPTAPGARGPRDDRLLAHGASITPQMKEGVHDRW